MQHGETQKPTKRGTRPSIWSYSPPIPNIHRRKEISGILTKVAIPVSQCRHRFPYRLADGTGLPLSTCAVAVIQFLNVTIRSNFIVSKEHYLSRSVVQVTRGVRCIRTFYRPLSTFLFHADVSPGALGISQPFFLSSLFLCRSEKKNREHDSTVTWQTHCHTAF